jgi:adenylate cyclase
MEAAADAFYLMLDSTQRSLHDRTNVSQLDAIGRVMGLKAELNLSRECFDKMVAV